MLIMTDTHLGARGGSATFRELFALYYKEVLFPYIKENAIETVLHLGDFWDNRNSLSLADIDYVMNEFIPLVEQCGAHFYIIAGNHDTHYKNTNRVNSLSVFARCKNVTVVDNDLIIVDSGGAKSFVMCPWINNENQEYLFKELEKYASDDYILCGHFEIKNALMYANSIPCEHGIDAERFKGFHRVLSGHFHHPSVYGNVEYIGALFHYNWEDVGDWRGFRTYDAVADTYELHENEYCLFSYLEYEEVKHIDNLTDYVQDKFVRLVVKEVYDKLEFKDFKRRVETFKPIDLSIIDYTIFEQESDTEEHTETSAQHATSTPIDYAEKYLETSEDKSSILSRFQSIYEIALANRKNIE